MLFQLHISNSLNLHSLRTPVTYIPKIVPEPPSPARKLAYSEGAAALSGPVDDPDGWLPLAPVDIHGKFQSRRAQLQCTVSAQTSANVK
jgi:hypothetical protein